MKRTETPWGPWEPAALSEVAALFSTARIPWWIAGGHAIELAVGHRFREHDDIDVLLLRRDQPAVQEVLSTWEWWAADPPGTLRPWQAGAALPVLNDDRRQWLAEAVARVYGDHPWGDRLQRHGRA